MNSLFDTLFRTLLLDDTAYQEWRERPNLFLRGIVLIVVVSLVAGLVSFGVNFVERAKPVDPDAIVESISESYRQQSRWDPRLQDPEARAMVDEIMETIVPMVRDIAEIEAPIPRGIGGFFQAFGGWLSRAFSAIGGWLLYGALVLIAVNLLGGSAKLPEFLGMVSLYVVPGLLGLLAALLGLLGSIPYLGVLFGLAETLLGLAALIWSIVVYVKATSVAARLDGGRAFVAVIAPLLAFVLLGILLAIFAGVWIVLLAAI